LTYASEILYKFSELWKTVAVSLNSDVFLVGWCCVDTSRCHSMG